MGDTPEMEDRFMGEILTDFYARVTKFDPVEEFAIVIRGDQDGTYTAAVVAGDTIIAKGSAPSWFEASSRAVARGLASLETIQERMAAMHEEE